MRKWCTQIIYTNRLAQIIYTNRLALNSLRVFLSSQIMCFKE